MSDTTRKIIYSAIGAALIAVLTMFPSIPVPGTQSGYVHLGDAMILIFVVLIGKYAIISARIGSMLADIILGAFQYAPATLVIKALVALIAFLIIRKGTGAIRFGIGCVAGEIVMVAGYFVYEWILFGIAVAAPAIVWNLFQGLFSVVLAVLVVLVLKKTGVLEKLRLENRTRTK